MEIIKIIFGHFTNDYSNCDTPPNAAGGLLSLNLVNTLWDVLVMETVTRIMVEGAVGWYDKAENVLTRWKRRRYEHAAGYRVRR